MPYIITSGQEATLLQLQYITESIGLRRTYLKDEVEIEYERVDDATCKLENIIKPIPTRTVDTVKRPDIEWHPSYKTYQARVARLAKSARTRPIAVPEGFPDQVMSARAWTGSDFADPDKFVVQLSADDVDEIKAALEFFKCTFVRTLTWR